jgi:cytidyltransferase-like protein
MADVTAKNGVFYGRFQPFHIGHLNAVKMCLERCETLYIGIRIFETIASFDISQLKKSSGENPFSFEERMRTFSL